MSGLLTTIQQIAINAASSMKIFDFCTGTVTSAAPLKIRMDESLLEIDGSAIVLTEGVVEKKMTIQKHHHDCENALTFNLSATATIEKPPLTGTVMFIPTPTEIQPGDEQPTPSAAVDFTHNHTIDDFVLEAVVTEFGKDLSVDRDDDRIVVTINEPLKEDDKVLMLAVMQGQKFIVLSRVFLREGKEDE